MKQFLFWNKTGKTPHLSGRGLLGLATALGLTVGLALSSPLESQEPVEMTYGLLAPRGTIWANTAQSMDNRIRHSTGNQVKLRIYYGGSKGSEGNMVNLMRTGSLDMASLTGIGLGQVLPSIRIMELPLFFTSTSQVDRVRKGLTGYFEDAFRKKGFEFLAWGEVGWVYLFTKEAITSTADLKKLKAWSPAGDPLVKAMLDDLGVLSYDYPITAVYPKLQSGQLDSVLSSTAGLVGLQWHNYVNYVAKIRLASGTGGTLLTNRAWQRIPAEHRETVKKIITEEAERLITITRAANTQSIGTLSAAGIKGMVLSADQKKMLEESAARTRRKMAGRLYPASLLRKAQGLR